MSGKLALYYKLFGTSSQLWFTIFLNFTTIHLILVPSLVVLLIKQIFSYMLYFFFNIKNPSWVYGCCSPLQLILEGNFIFVNNRILGAASMYNKTMQNNEFPNLIIILCLFSNFFGYSIYYLCPRTSLFENFWLVRH